MSQPANGPSVVVADDDEEVLKVLSSILIEIGYPVAGRARNGREAVELTRALQPDFVIFDVVMPVLDGVEAAREILAERHLPVILATALGTEERIEAARQLNVQAFLLKPFSLAQLRSSIAIAFAQHEVQAADRRKIADLTAALAAAQPAPVSLAACGLTPRETEVLTHLVEGRTNAEIATALGSATRTVEKHVEHVLHKLGVSTRMAAVRKVRP